MNNKTDHAKERMIARCTLKRKRDIEGKKVKKKQRKRKKSG